MELLSPLSENPDGLSLFGLFCLVGFLGGLVCCCWGFFGGCLGFLLVCFGICLFVVCLVLFVFIILSFFNALLKFHYCFSVLTEVGF